MFAKSAGTTLATDMTISSCIAVAAQQPYQCARFAGAAKNYDAGCHQIVKRYRT